MLTNLYISSKKCEHYKEIDIVKLINHEVQITKNVNKIKNLGIEYGFHIKIIEKIENKELKILWEILKKELNLQCAYIRQEPDYMGCILNKPGLYFKSRCPINETRS